MNTDPNTQAPDGADDEKAKALRLVSKLLAKSAGTSNENEARAFEAKARELMSRHGILPEDLLSSGLIERRETYPGRRNAPRWLVALWGAVGSNLGVYVLTSSGVRFTVWLYGTEADVERAVYMARFLEAEVERRAAAYAKAHRTGKGAATSYRVGLVAGIDARLRFLAATVAPDKANPFAVVLVGAQARTEAAKGEAHRRNEKIGTARGYTPTHAGATRAGILDSEDVTIAKAVTAATEETGRLLTSGA